MRIIDFHVHLCQDRKIERLVFPKSDWPLEWYWANPNDVIPYMNAREISELVTMNIMDTSAMVDARLAQLYQSDPSEAEITANKSKLKSEMIERVQRFNSWACQTHLETPRILFFMMADPVLFGDQLIPEVERCLTLGASGVKLHPSICQHLPTHPMLFNLYEYCQEFQIPVLTDTNSHDKPENIGYGFPQHWRPILKDFPRLKLVMAHFCEGMWDERLDLAREFPNNLWFDISGGMVDTTHPAGGHRHLPAEQAPRIFRKVGIERIFFGSDEPAAGLDVQDYVWQVLRLPLREAEKERILWGNAKDFLDIKT